MSQDRVFLSDSFIPHQHSSLVPDRNLPIINVLSFPFPPSVPPAPYEDAELSAFFSPKPPDPGPLDLSTTTIPSFAHLLSRAALATQWECSMRSICLKVNNVVRYLHFWVGSLWYKLSPAIAGRNQWARARAWAHSRIHSRPAPTLFAHLQSAVDRFFKVVGWDAPISSSLRSLQLADLFSDRYLPGTVIDGYPLYLSILSDSEVGSLRPPDAGHLSHLRNVANQLRTGNIDGVVYPLHDPRHNHYVAALFDARTGELRIGDSCISGALPPDAVHDADLAGYCQFARKLGLDLNPNIAILPHSIQDDPFSCGIVTLNTIERVFFRDIWPWSPHTKHLERIEWALLLATQLGSQYFLDDLNLPDNFISLHLNRGFIALDTSIAVDDTDMDNNDSDFNTSIAADNMNTNFNFSDLDNSSFVLVHDDTNSVANADVYSEYDNCDYSYTNSSEASQPTSISGTLPLPLSQPSKLVKCQTASLAQTTLTAFYASITRAELEAARVRTRPERLAEAEDVAEHAARKDNMERLAHEAHMKEREHEKKRQYRQHRRARKHAASNASAATVVADTVPTPSQPSVASILDKSSTIPISPALPTTSAETSRPYRQFHELVQATTRSQVGRKRKNLPTNALRYNWIHSLIFQQIDHARYIVGWSPQEIDSILAHVATGNKPQALITRFGVLELHPGLVTAIAEQLTYLREVGIPVSIAVSRAIMLALIQHHAPGILHASAPDGRPFLCSKTFVRRSFPTSMTLDTRIATLRNRSVSWGVKAYHAINHPELIKQAFSRCEIKGGFNLSYESLTSDDALKALRELPRTDPELDRQLSQEAANSTRPQDIAAASADEPADELTDPFENDKQHDDDTWMEPVDLMSWILHPGNDASALPTGPGMADDPDVNLEELYVPEEVVFGRGKRRKVSNTRYEGFSGH
ncbi:hypothetical protein CONPUDRAFT_156863 [Coniophora puteana RWD-64-598 SS2]|uniref:Ubiquitin-like protease family profile domain-containing protein n=1 Tax=Coniophora puteana (strain RWD-64-598) TaxID=741705 RepID=A0A5M3MEM1_CONPW|nr:uncharacterized protein CONPUDRAFT_156863 [Coniophora puteana RWD-64-598 SS2]EIW77672.1 hypothetical protein CONPUDRAFT_156863 [Coniophora puteana RWD-64-598 SS2]